MRVIFLDFDGVLNHRGTWERLARTCEAEDRQWQDHEVLEPDLVRRIGALALECGAVLAVVSSLRQRLVRTELADMLRAAGLQDGVVVARCASGCSKGEAVCRFIAGQKDRSRPVTAYVVVDDGPGELPDPTRWVKTDGAVGFTDADCAHAKRLLLE